VPPTAPKTPNERPGWTFLSNHAHVLLCLAEDPEMRLRDVALLVGVTERTAQLIVADLEAEGYLVRERVGRRNHYRLHLERPLRHPLARRHRIGELVDVLASAAPPSPARTKRAGGARAKRAGGSATPTSRTGRTASRTKR
jgi:hypothetical protein